MVFYVPNDSGEKVTLGISAMLTMVVFLMTMTDAMPPATSTPLLSKTQENCANSWIWIHLF
jgi:nicotinic acetylcholine receptor alpha-7